MGVCCGISANKILKLIIYYRQTRKLVHNPAEQTERIRSITGW